MTTLNDIIEALWGSYVGAVHAIRNGPRPEIRAMMGDPEPHRELFTRAEVEADLIVSADHRAERRAAGEPELDPYDWDEHEDDE